MKCHKHRQIHGTSRKRQNNNSNTTARSPSKVTISLLQRVDCKPKKEQLSTAKQGPNTMGATATTTTWRSSHYTVKHMRNKISNSQGSSPNYCSKSDFPYHKKLLLRERIRSLWEPILSFKRSSHSVKGTQLKRTTA